MIPATVGDMTMKNVRLTATAIFEPMPRPNHSRNSDASAMRVMAYSNGW